MVAPHFRILFFRKFLLSVFSIVSLSELNLNLKRYLRIAFPFLELYNRAVNAFLPLR